MLKRKTFLPLVVAGSMVLAAPIVADAAEVTGIEYGSTGSNTIMSFIVEGIDGNDSLDEAMIESGTVVTTSPATTNVITSSVFFYPDPNNPNYNVAEVRLLTKDYNGVIFNLQPFADIQVDLSAVRTADGDNLEDAGGSSIFNFTTVFDAAAWRGMSMTVADLNRIKQEYTDSTYEKVLYSLNKVSDTHSPNLPYKPYDDYSCAEARTIYNDMGTTFRWAPEAALKNILDGSLTTRNITDIKDNLLAWFDLPVPFWYNSSCDWWEPAANASTAFKLVNQAVDMYIHANNELGIAPPKSFFDSYRAWIEAAVIYADQNAADADKQGGDKYVYMNIIRGGIANVYAPKAFLNADYNQYAALDAYDAASIVFQENGIFEVFDWPEGLPSHELLRDSPCSNGYYNDKIGDNDGDDFGHASLLRQVEAKTTQYTQNMFGDRTFRTRTNDNGIDRKTGDQRMFSIYMDPASVYYDNTCINGNQGEDEGTFYTYAAANFTIAATIYDDQEMLELYWLNVSNVKSSGVNTLYVDDTQVFQVPIYASGGGGGGGSSSDVITAVSADIKGKTVDVSYQLDNSSEAYAVEVLYIWKDGTNGTATTRGTSVTLPIDPGNLTRITLTAVELKTGDKLSPISFDVVLQGPDEDLIMTTPLVNYVGDTVTVGGYGANPGDRCGLIVSPDPVVNWNDTYYPAGKADWQGQFGLADITLPASGVHYMTGLCGGRPVKYTKIVPLNILD